jgi:hypothetical protein
VTRPALRQSISDGAIQHFLQSQIASNPLVPQPSPNGLYFIYLPPGVSVAQGGARSCQAFCGYHNDIAGQIYYAVMPYPGCGGCTGGLSLLDALTSTSSHELSEAITDAVPGQGWYDDPGNAEIGDLCAWRTKQVAGATVQLEWSNKLARASSVRREALDLTPARSFSMKRGPTVNPAFDSALRKGGCAHDLEFGHEDGWTSVPHRRPDSRAGGSGQGRVGLGTRREVHVGPAIRERAWRELRPSTNHGDLRAALHHVNQRKPRGSGPGC